ncbi:MAG: hypothetical protein HYW69_01325 [Candidatus Nealsonbacteria bacterium]|nr:hypothetical protein [Candidatus Nealsonbacteria bacterium]
MASRVYYGENSSGIQGKTPLARIQSIVSSLNSNIDYKNLGRVSLLGYNAESQAWNFSLIVFKPSKEITQPDQQIIFSLIKDIFVKASGQIFGNTGINILAIYPDGKVFLLSMSPDSVKEIKRYEERGEDPEDWYRYVSEVPASIQLQQENQQEQSPKEQNK